MSFRITHIDMLGRKHQEVKTFESAASAGAWAEAQYGPARYLSTICLRGGHV